MNQNDSSDIEKTQSDNVSVTSQESSDTVTDDLTCAKIIQNLQLAAQDAVETGDYLSYSTLVDMYFSDLSHFSREETESVLQQLLSVLKENNTLTHEIGWDIPSIIIPYIESDQPFRGSIRSIPNIYIIIKIFEVLALQGNPKELFLKGCEILSNLKITQGIDPSQQLEREKYFDVKCHCLFELIKACLKRITTLYPSRFLAMATTSLINLLHTNASTIQSSLFLVRRFYSFARDYIPPRRPKDKEDSEKVKEDEEFLQRKLLTSFLTYVSELVSRNAICQLSLIYYSKLQKGCPQSILDELQRFARDTEITERYVGLATSLDIDLEGSFKESVDNAKTMLTNINFEEDEDESVSQLFEKCVVNYQNLAPIVSGDVSKITDSSVGKLLLYTSLVCQGNTPKIKFFDVLALTLQNLVPGMVEKSYQSNGLQDASVFWGWAALSSSSTNESISEIASVPAVLIKLYLQALTTCCATPVDANFRYVTLTLLTRVLSLASESISYTFLKDSLMTCPYPSIKSPLIGILKDLLIRDKTFTDDILSKFENISLKSVTPSSLSSSPSSKPLVTPLLPPRNKFIILNENRKTEILSLVETSITDTFIEKNSQIILNAEEFSSLLSYLNLLIVIKGKLPAQNVDSIVKLVESKITQYKEINSDSQDINVDILTIALDRIKSL